jgi:hypothetical protein
VNLFNFLVLCQQERFSKKCIRIPFLNRGKEVNKNSGLPRDSPASRAACKLTGSLANPVVQHSRHTRPALQQIEGIVQTTMDIKKSITFFLQLLG